MSASVVFIDSAVANYQAIRDAYAPDVECIVLDSDSDGLSQIVHALAGRANLDAIHIVSHGAEASLLLGASSLNKTNVAAYGELLAQIGQSLNPTGDILLYGCNVGAGEDGQKFVDALAQYTGAEVAASNDVTGAAALGGDWSLEVSTGQIETQAVSAASWQGTLGANTTLVNYDLNLMADLAELAKAAYLSGTALANAVNSLGWRNADPKSVSNAQVFMADRVVDGNKEMVIAFRGTEFGTSETAADLITDLSTWGFSNYYKNVRSSVEDWLVKAYLGDYDKVYVTGHSLGGAAAQIALLDILEDNNSPIWTAISDGSSSGTPLQVGDRFMDTRRSDLRIAVKEYVKTHVQGATFGAPNIGIDSPNTWLIPFHDTYALNTSLNLASYKQKLVQFEHKIGSGNTAIQQFLTTVAGTTRQDILDKAIDFLILGAAAVIGDVTLSVVESVLVKMLQASLDGQPIETRNDDFVAMLDTASVDNDGNVTWLPELGLLQAIDLNDTVYNRYSSLSGGSTGFIMLHPMSYYAESLIRAMTDNSLITPTPSPRDFSGQYPTLAQVSAGTTGNDLIQAGTTASGLAGHDILVASANTSNLIGGLGNDAFVIKQAGANIVLSGSKERKDHLYFNMEGEITTEVNGEALEITLSGPSGSRKVIINNWYAGGGNAYQLYEVAKITPVTVVTQATLTQNNSYYNQADLANRNLAALGIAFLNEGGSLGDSILGSLSNDTMHGYEGDDNMSGRDGNDIIYGDTGNDYIEAGAGNDTVVDNEGFNTINGGLGDDVITASHAVVNGGEGSDTLIANMSELSSFYGNYYNSANGNNGLYYRNAGNAIISHGSAIEAVESFLEDGTGRIDVYNGNYDSTNAIGLLASWQGIEKMSVTGLNKSNDYEGNDLLMVVGTGGTYNGGSAAGYDTLYANWGAATSTQAINWDSSLTAVQTLYLGTKVQDIERVLLRLGAGNDVIKNTNATSDQIYAGAGNDTINLGAGANFVDGGDGNDTISALANSNWSEFRGGTGDDALMGSRGAYVGGDGNDTLMANMSGLSSFYGNYYNSANGNNGLYYRNAGNAIISHGSAIEAVESFLGDGTGRIDVYNGNYDSTNAIGLLASWQGIEKMSVTGLNKSNDYEGNDLLMVVGTGGTYNGGNAANYDTLYADWSVATSTQAIVWDSSLTAPQTLYQGTKVQDIERVLLRLGAGNDVIKNTNATSDQIYAGAGNDTINLGAGANFVDGGDGNDTISALANSNWSEFRGGTGDDALMGSRGAYVGGDGNDTLTANMSELSSFYGNYYNSANGNNGLYYRNAGNAIISHGSAIEAVESFLGDGTGRIDVYNGNYDSTNAIGLLASWQNIERMSVTGLSQTGGYEGNDLLIVVGTGGTYNGGTAANYDTLYANWSTATTAISLNNNTSDPIVVNGITIQNIERLLLKTGSGADIIRNVSYAFGDHIIAGAGNDQLYTGAGADLLKGDAGNDTLDGGAGADRLEGGTGNDVYFVDNTGDVTAELENNGTDKVNASVTYTLAAYIEELVLTGAGNINGNGNSAHNALTGNTGDNVLDGGLGNDTLRGGLGNDTFYVDSAGDVVIENAGQGTDTVQSTLSFSLAGINAENVVLLGTLANNATGNGLNNNLTGNSAANLLNGGTGVDSLTGGAGDDTYVVDSGLDTVLENASQGTDTLQSSVTYTLGTNLENIVLTGVANIGAVGNSLNNVLTGNSGTNTLTGGTGNDTYVVNNSTDLVVENASEGTDVVQASISYTLSANVESLMLTGTANIAGTGTDTHNSLMGNSGSNILDGGLGADTLAGSLGNDTYLVESNTDAIVELLAEGTDTVQATVNYTLSANVEHLTLVGGVATQGVGNNLNNTLTGNALNNLLTGGEGDDVLNGGAGNDTLTGGLGNDVYTMDSQSDVITENANEGTDTVKVAFNYVLGTTLENLTLTGTASNATGNSLSNMLVGNSSNNWLDGLAGADTLIGGMGADTYLVDSMGDVVQESSTVVTEIDWVRASTSHTLSNYVEKLTLTGTLAINGTGNNLANTLTGNGAANTLSGWQGNDTLDGGVGTDALYGGAGNDVYVMARGYGVDTVVENDATAGNTDVVSFTAGIASDQLWFRHVANNLEISIIGTSNKVVVQDWYSGAANRVEQIKTTDGNKILLSSKVENLVTAMAALTPPPFGQTTLSTQQHTQLDGVIAANWA